MLDALMAVQCPHRDDDDVDVEEEARTIELVMKHLARVHRDKRVEASLDVHLVAPNDAASSALFADELAKTEFRRVHSASARQCFYLPPHAFFAQYDHDDEVDDVRFWLIVNVNATNRVHISLYVGELDVTLLDAIFAFAQSVVTRTSRRLSQLLLLNALHQTRVCSPLLIPPDVCAVTDVTDVDDADVDLWSFAPGHFACDRVHSMHLALHDRLPAAVALQTLAETALHPFAVTNRRHVFVYQQKCGAVFFLRIIDAAVNDEHDEGLLVEVFGVDVPGAEIVVQLRELLESKIAAITLSMLSTMLARNAQFKLMSADVELLRPRASAPARAILLALPADVDDAYLFMLFLSQTLLHFLSPLHFASSSASASASSSSRVIEQQQQRRRPRRREGSRTARWSWTDFAFVYNCAHRFETLKSMKSVGSGLSSVFCSLVAPDGPTTLRHVDTSVDLSGDGALPRVDDINDPPIQIPLDVVELPRKVGGISRMEEFPDDDDDDDDGDVVDVDDANGGFGRRERALMFEVWKLGNVNVDALVTLLCESFQQTLADFRIERVLHHAATHSRQPPPDILNRRLQSAVVAQRFVVLIFVTTT